MEEDDCYICKNFIAIGEDGFCDIYGEPNHGVSYCQDWIKKERDDL